MLLSSTLPWLKDPLTGDYSAWRLPIDIGWQVRFVWCNYGTLCLICAIYAFLVAYANWKPFKGSAYFSHKQIAAGLLCGAPILLFLLQYLIADVAGIDKLFQHEVQLQLIQSHFGYNSPAQLVRIDIFNSDTSTLGERLRLLIDVGSIGVVLPLISCWLLIGYRRFTVRQPVPIRRGSFYVEVLYCVLGILSVFILGRACAATLCEYQGKASLATGNYTKALQWLNTAHTLNPALDQVYYYHVERGQAQYFLHSTALTEDSQAYLALTASQQGNDLDAYQQLLTVWHQHPTTPWIVKELSYTLEKLSEFNEPLKGVLVQRPINDDGALSWLELLNQINPSSTYGSYVEGRIQFDLHNYSACIKEMTNVAQASTNTDIESSAYTYVALSYTGQGDLLKGRVFLKKAITLDPQYMNNTAREELSGLR